jgi:hypothetical protein
MADRPARLSRRQLGKLLLTAPLATPARGQEANRREEPPTPEARFIASQEAGLSAEERAALEKSVTGQKKMLDTIRAFDLPVDTPPAFRFAARKSRRG